MLFKFKQGTGKTFDEIRDKEVEIIWQMQGFYSGQKERSNVDYEAIGKYFEEKLIKLVENGFLEIEQSE